MPSLGEGTVCLNRQGSFAGLLGIWGVPGSEARLRPPHNVLANKDPASKRVGFSLGPGWIPRISHRLVGKGRTRKAGGVGFWSHRRPPSNVSIRQRGGGIPGRRIISWPRMHGRCSQPVGRICCAVLIDLALGGSHASITVALPCDVLHLAGCLVSRDRVGGLSCGSS